MPTPSTKTRKSVKTLSTSGSAGGKNNSFVKRILVPVTFSKAEKPALEYAKSLATLTGAKVYILHVIERIYPKERPYSHITIDMGAMKESIIRSIETFQVDLFEGIRTEMLLANGTAFAEIIAAAKKNDIDLIVMSTHGFKGITRLVVGSTAERVVRYATCPVLVVPGKQPRRRK